MRRDTEKALHALRDRLEQNKRQLRGDLKGWSVSSEVLATKYDTIICEIQAIVDADRDAERVAEEASGFEVLQRSIVNDEICQAIRYRSTGREGNQHWTRDALRKMTSTEFARKVDGLV